METDIPQSDSNKLNGDTSGDVQDEVEQHLDNMRQPKLDDILLLAKDEKTDKLIIDKNVDTDPMTASAVVQQPPVTCDNSCKNSAGTQSSSINDNIDFQETVILRRQQLSRVAEWVQNNTQQMERQQQHDLDKLNLCESSTTDHQSSSFSTLDQLDSVSVEKMSMDSGYKTTPQFQQVANSSQEDTIKTSDDSLSPKSELNMTTEIPTQFAVDETNTATNYPGSPTPVADPNIYSSSQTYYRRTSRSGLPVAYTTSDPQDSSSQCSQIIPEQPTCDIVNYKYYPSDSDRTRALQPDPHVDIAQMEYNVKQFLLKQNEWSMRTTSNQNPITIAPTPQPSTVLNRHSSIRPIKLFSSTSGAGFGPGKGERVLNFSNNLTTTTTTSTLSTAGNTSMHNIDSRMPQRTETNL